MQSLYSWVASNNQQTLSVFASRSLTHVFDPLTLYWSVITTCYSYYVNLNWAAVDWAVSIFGCLDPHSSFAMDEVFPVDDAEKERKKEIFKTKIFRTSKSIVLDSCECLMFLYVFYWFWKEKLKKYTVIVIFNTVRCWCCMKSSRTTDYFQGKCHHVKNGYFDVHLWYRHFHTQFWGVWYVCFCFVFKEDLVFQKHICKCIDTCELLSRILLVNILNEYYY